MITNRRSSPRRPGRHKTAIAALLALALPLASVPAAQATETHEGFMTADRVFDWDRDQPSYGSQRPNRGNSWYGPGRDENVAGWAIGTFRGQNSGNGVEETITIRPDGSAELRTRDSAPKYGTFAGETLTIGNRMSRVQPTRGGIQVDGAYYYR
jgi:hypothetical protein